VAEADQLQFELDQSPRLAAILGRVEREGSSGFPERHPARVNVDVRQDVAQDQHSVVFTLKGDIAGSVSRRLHHSERPDLVAFSESTRLRILYTRRQEVPITFIRQKSTRLIETTDTSRPARPISRTFLYETIASCN
jgi:hypothetical protein